IPARTAPRSGISVGAEPGAPSSASGLLFLAAGEPIEPLLHLHELSFQLVDLAARRLRFVLFRSLALAPGNRREHCQRAREHLHVAADLILERTERAHPESLRHLLAEFFLLARERLDRDLEIARHQHLHAVAIEADQLPQKSDW